MSSAKKFIDHSKGYKGNKLTPAEKKQKEEEHLKKMEEARKKAEVDAASLINRADECIKDINGTKTIKIPQNIDEIYKNASFLKSLIKDNEQTEFFFKKFSTLQGDINQIHRPLLCEETSTEFMSRVGKINDFLILLKNTFKEKNYAVADAALKAKDLAYYLDVLHPLMFKAHNVLTYDGLSMLSWEECTEKFAIYDLIATEENEPIKKKAIMEHTATFTPIVERFNKINLQGDPFETYKALLQIWTDLIPIIHRQELLEKPKELDKFKSNLFAAMAVIFAKCQFGKQIFPRCDEEMKLHIKAYATSPSLFNNYQDEFESIRAGNVN